ncbi:LysR substrate-binding domain-containing protein [Winogradskya consettensis]|uniref:LysR family transcriptional regulator n=1 Tax=Winogradskya consettensis TaxID=113560 RepID=A0A919STP1_9ACTN|nr:LysR family transcriptional regulator [Actinoplanes consettensis]GIM77419.1 LysR family transcriptional regulator [Actinoplanes consettensis]
MDLRQLTSFTMLAQELHFGRAAARLHLAQPALSQQIRQLEKELGNTLFTRSTRRVELTEAGTLLLERAGTILALLTRAEDEQARLAQGRAGQVSIGFIGTATYDVLPGVARKLRAGLPDLRLDLRGEMLTPELVTGVLDYSLDVALMRPPTDRAGLDVVPLRTEALVAALRADDPRAGAGVLDLTTLAMEPFVSHPSRRLSSMHQSLLDTCRAAGFQPREIIEVRETSTLVTFVAAGMGVALVPASVRSLGIDGVAYVPLLQRSATVDLVMATRSAETSPGVRRVAQLIAAHVRGGPAALPDPASVWRGPRP